MSQNLDSTSAPDPSANAAPQRTLLLLVRHGQTPTTGQLLPGRAPGLHLSERGKAQATEVASRLRDIPLDAIYSSPLERTLETAAPTAAAKGLSVTHDVGLLECDFGAWTGAALTDLYKVPEWSTVQNSPSTFRFPDGESFTEMQQRMVGALEAIATDNPDATVACFSHADTIKAAIAHAMGTALDNFQRIFVSPASISIIALVAGRPPEILTVNSTDGSLGEFFTPATPVTQ